MLNRIQTTTGVVTIGFVILSLIYNQTGVNNRKASNSHSYRDVFEYSSELNELRRDLNELKSKVFHIEETFLSSTVSTSIFSWLPNDLFSFLLSLLVLHSLHIFFFISFISASSMHQQHRR